MKKQIENIFSNSKTEIKEIPNKKCPIIVDTREKQSLISANLLEKNANIKFEKLEVGDYLINNIAVERKTFSDFQSSIVNKRLIEQLSNIKKYPVSLLIIEGFLFDYSDSHLHENAIRGMILSSVLDFGVPVVFTKNEDDTASFLIVLAKRQEKEKPELSTRPEKTAKTLEEQKQFILEGFPGIGATLSKRIIEKFKTLKAIFKASKKQLSEIEGFGEPAIKEFKKILEE
jgi:Fanconi anemia group M protein